MRLRSSTFLSVNGENASGYRSATSGSTVNAMRCNLVPSDGDIRLRSAQRVGVLTGADRADRSPAADERLRPVDGSDAHQPPGAVAVQRRQSWGVGVVDDQLALDVRPGVTGQLDLPAVLVAPHVAVARAADQVVRVGDVVRDRARLLDGARPVLVAAL